MLAHRAAKYAKVFFAIFRPVWQGLGPIIVVFAIFIAAEDRKRIARQVEFTGHHLTQPVDRVSLPMSNSILLFAHRLVIWRPRSLHLL